MTEKDHEAARGEQPLYYSNRHFQGIEFRVLTIPATPYAVQIARPLGEVNRTLHRITLFLILIAVGGMGVAAALGLLVSRAALAPVRRLTETTEAVTETRDLSQRIESTSTGEDELGRLATSFNTMLAALEDSSRAQRQLVADASHELRTPLTSLKTNIEVLARGNELAPEAREQLLRDVVEQIDEMTALIGELIELAREARPDAVVEPARDVRLDLVAADAIERTRRNRPGIEFETDLDESIVYGAPSTIERAVANLLDNAAKWSPPGGQVEVAVRQGELSVRDHGPGIADEDLPYVFDRFYRSRTARGLPGSGLGLAIVKQVAESHGGSVVAEQPQDGGTLMRLRLNGRAALSDFSASSHAGSQRRLVSSEGVATSPSRIGEARRRAADAKQAAAALAAAGFLAIALLARASHPAHVSSATGTSTGFVGAVGGRRRLQPPAGSARPERAAPRAARRRESRDRRGRHRLVRGSGRRDARLPAAERLRRRRAAALRPREAEALAAVRARGRPPLPRHPRRRVHRRSTAAALLLDHVVPFSLAPAARPGTDSLPAAVRSRSGSSRPSCSPRWR